MKRALVWMVGGFAVLILGIFAALWLGTTPRSADAPSATAAVATVPATPAPPLDAPLLPAPAPAGAGGAFAAPAPPASVAEAGQAARAPAAFRTAHEQRRAEVRERARERARAHREEVARRRAARLEQHEKWTAARAPDPNRPAPQRERLHLGPGIIPESGERSPD